LGNLTVRVLLLLQRQEKQMQPRKGDSLEDGTSRGRSADWPSQIPFAGWKDIFWRVYADIMEDRILLVAAGATFYLLLALFPALTAFVSLYGFFADPASVAQHVNTLGMMLPSGGVEIVQEQLENLATQDSGALSFGFVLGFLFAFWSANNGVKTLFEALNIAYDESEKRSFIRLNLTAFAFTMGAMVTAIMLIAAVGLVPLILSFLNIGQFAEALLATLRWLVLLLLIAVGISLLYRYGPSRAPAKWRWISWGSAFATLVWLAASAGFSYYLQNFGNYEAVYGSLGAAIGFMMWTWISVTILIVGAELNAEMEHQTARDSTTGKPQPIGKRGAVMADTVGQSAEQQ
jgi:membrane protein